MDVRVSFSRLRKIYYSRWLINQCLQSQKMAREFNIHLRFSNHFHKIVTEIVQQTSRMLKISTEQKRFSFQCFGETNSRAVCLRRRYCKVHTAQGTNQNAPLFIVDQFAMQLIIGSIIVTHTSKLPAIRM